jgi:hypothetical protein
MLGHKTHKASEKGLISYEYFLVSLILILHSLPLMDDYKNADMNFAYQYLSRVVGETINYSLELPWIEKTPIGAKQPLSITSLLLTILILNMNLKGIFLWQRNGI